MVAESQLLDGVDAGGIGAGERAGASERLCLRALDSTIAAVAPMLLEKESELSENVRLRNQAERVRRQGAEAAAQRVARHGAVEAHAIDMGSDSDGSARPLARVTSAPGGRDTGGGDDDSSIDEDVGDGGDDENDTAVQPALRSKPRLQRLNSISEWLGISLADRNTGAKSSFRDAAAGVDEEEAFEAGRRRKVKSLVDILIPRRGTNGSSGNKARSFEAGGEFERADDSSTSSSGSYDASGDDSEYYGSSESEVDEAKERRQDTIGALSAQFLEASQMQSEIATAALAAAADAAEHGDDAGAAETAVALQSEAESMAENLLRMERALEALGAAEGKIEANKASRKGGRAKATTRRAGKKKPAAGGTRKAARRAPGSGRGKARKRAGKRAT